MLFTRKNTNTVLNTIMTLSKIKKRLHLSWRYREASKVSLLLLVRRPTIFVINAFLHMINQYVVLGFKHCINIKLEKLTLKVWHVFVVVGR